MKKKQKMYVVKKFIMANSVPDAIRKERKTPVDSVWIDEEWSKGQAKELAGAIGFNIETNEE